MSMLIAIPTRGRADQVMSSTLSLIPSHLWNQTVLWTHSDDWEDYDTRIPGDWKDAGLCIEYSTYSTIGEKRHQIGKYAKRNGFDKFVMLDDDIDFLIRRSHDDWRLRACTPTEVELMFLTIEEQLNNYAQVAISPREGNNRFGLGDPYTLLAECTRAMRITGYRTKDFLSVEHNRLQFMEDFDVLLQLLEQGKKNAVLAYWANGQKMTNAPGGCSLTRTLETHNRAAEKLAELHPRYVRLRLKQNKTDAEGLGTRKEVTVSWKKAYIEGIDNVRNDS